MALLGCSDDDNTTDTTSSSTASTGSGAGGEASGGNGGAGGAGEGGSGASGGGGGAGGNAPQPCDLQNPMPPPADVLWPSVISDSGMATLNGHGHDDGKGPVGFCSTAPMSGEPYYKIIAVGFETDQDLNNDNDDNDGLPVDFYADPNSYTGVGESGGRINIYAQLLDEMGNVLSGQSAPELRYELTIEGTEPLSLPLDNKPSNEFQTNFPMTGGNTYGISVEGHSDRVFNMRLPNNHHVTFIVVFQRQAP